MEVIKNIKHTKKKIVLALNWILEHSVIVNQLRFPSIYRRHLPSWLYLQPTVFELLIVFSVFILRKLKWDKEALFGS